MGLKKFKYEKVTIVGMGLMGGSLGLALRQRWLAKNIFAVGRNPAKLRAAKISGAANVVTTDFEKGVRDADVVVLCVPVNHISETFKKISPFLNDKTVVTDMGSVKNSVALEMKDMKRSELFVGSHPMVGSEKRGIKNIIRGLFEGGVCIMTPEKRSKPATVKKVEQFWKSVGMKIVIMTPRAHDSVVSATSHLPHAVAFALVNKSRTDIIKNKDLFGQGFKGTTRVAGAGEEIWSDIITSNKKEIVKDIRLFIAEMKRLEKIIDKGTDSEIRRYVKKTRELRERLDK